MGTDVSGAGSDFVFGGGQSVPGGLHQRQRRRRDPRLMPLHRQRVLCSWLARRSRPHLNDRAHRSSFSAVPGRAGRFPTPHPAESSTRGGSVPIRTTQFEHVFVRLSSSCICVRSYREGLTKWRAPGCARVVQPFRVRSDGPPPALTGPRDDMSWRPRRHSRMRRQGYAVLVQDAVGIAELSRPDFLAHIDNFVTIYAAAMQAGPDELPSREAIMRRHTGNPGFRALAVYRGTPARIVAFTYGFHGQHGQWWHDVVHAGLIRQADQATANGWLDDVVEVA